MPALQLAPFRGNSGIMQIKTLIIGAGAAGMMCAAHAGPNALLIDHAKAAGEKIRISGGGRCNFTNLDTRPENFISGNPHFAKSALARYTQWDFIELVARHGIAYHEKTLGQLFCDNSAKDIIAMLRAEMGNTPLWLKTSVQSIRKTASGFETIVMRDDRETVIKHAALVIATGGKSIPKMGATGFAYQIAAQFGLPVLPTRAGLVPLTFTDGRFGSMSGTALPASVQANGPTFEEALLFTHRGLSGPAILQASSYWQEGQDIAINLIPKLDLFSALRERRSSDGRKALTTVLSQYLPNKLITYLAHEMPLIGNLADHSDASLRSICDYLTRWHQTPSGSEGYRTAEVTLGGIDTNALDAKTMQAKHVPGLYFIGECVDVTGWLGGYNFQWAWSSGWTAGQAVRRFHGY